MLKTLEQICTPRRSVFDPSVQDTVYNIDDLDSIDPQRFFDENYVTSGMRQLLTEAFKRLEGTSESASGAFLLSQSMGGGKTHNLLALGLLAKYPKLRAPVMSSFYTPGPLGAVRVVTFSGRKTNTPFGIWGEIAEKLNRSEVLRDFYQPPKPPGDEDWVELLRGEPILILLDELPPYFQAARAVQVGATTLDDITTTAIANLLVAVSSGKLPNVCVVLTDLRAAAYSVGSTAISEALRNLEQEANRSVTPIDPVRLATDELYDILRTRLFERTAEDTDVEAVADAYVPAVDEARKMDLTTASAQTLRSEITKTYPFHPGIRDLFARFRENPGFQQTRAIIRIMRIIVADLWQSGAARDQYLIGAHDLDIRRADIMSEIRQINNTLENAVAHDIAEESGGTVAEEIDRELGGTDAHDASTLIFLSSLSQAVNPVLGLNRSEIVGLLAAPGRELSRLRKALDRLQSDAWYLHATATGQLLFRNVENLNAKLESYAGPMLREVRETELRERLKEMLAPKIGACYQEVLPLPALDEVQITQERVSLVVFRPSSSSLENITVFWDHQQFKNRVLFLTGNPTGYERVLERSAYLRAIRQIMREFREQGVRDTDPQFVDALHIQDREESQFYLACRETFQRLYYPARRGLVQFDLDPKYVANKYEGEQQVIAALTETYKYREDTSADSPSFRRALEERLWPEGQREVPWSDIKRRAATDPSWVWHHPRALDDLREELIQRDIWRDIGAGYIQRGPFPKPKTGVMVQELNRDADTGKVTLRVRPLYADTVYYSEEGTATISSARLESYDLESAALQVSFLAVDSKGDHETGEPYPWTNTIEVKYRLFQQGDERMCELRAIPSGEIRYTVDGSSPETSGQLYTGPFPVPIGTQLILAQAQCQGIVSRELRVEVSEDIEEFRVDANKPALWRRQWKRDSTADTYEFLEMTEKHGALLGGPKIDVGKDSRWVSFATDEQTFRSSAEVRELASLFAQIIPAGAVALTTEVLKFNRGQDLEDLVAELRTSLEADEVEQ